MFYNQAGRIAPGLWIALFASCLLSHFSALSGSFKLIDKYCISYSYVYPDKEKGSRLKGQDNVNR